MPCLACPRRKLIPRASYVRPRMDHLTALFSIPGENPDQYRVCHACFVRFRRCSGLGGKAHTKCVETMQPRCRQYLWRLMKELPRDSYPRSPVLRQAMQHDGSSSREPASSCTLRCGDPHSRDVASTTTPAGTAVHSPASQHRHVPPPPPAAAAAAAATAVVAAATAAEVAPAAFQPTHMESTEEDSCSPEVVRTVADDRRTSPASRRRGPESRAERAVREEHAKDSAAVAVIMNSAGDVEVSASVDVDVVVGATVRPHQCAPSMYHPRIMQSSAQIFSDMKRDVAADVKETEACA